MLINEKPRLSSLLAKTASALDISDSAYEEATLKYEEVGDWLRGEGSPLDRFSPEIYPQGSFRLGTVVRPIAAYDYDIDLVCRLNLQKESTTQADLKKMVGDRLKENERFKEILSPSRRCWLLDYPLEAGIPAFHMDILPAISNTERPPEGILLTDTQLRLWQKSNPKAYSTWFFERMKLILTEKRAALAKTLGASVEQVPEWQVKTPLQIAIQILKRHRDIFFQQEPSIRTASIIITTLAANAYRNQPDVSDALYDILQNMTQLLVRIDGRWWVRNPVEPDENFAERWNEDLELLTGFLRWIVRARQDFTNVGQKNNLNEAVATLNPLIGSSTMAKVAQNIGIQSSGNAIQSTQIPPLGDAEHCERPPWPVHPYYSAKVSTTVHYSRNGKKLWDYVGRPLPKNVWLKFALVTDTPPPYGVRWQVVNTGKEAAEAGQLRGTFYEGNGTAKTLHWERTAFRGTHWVETFVIKDGVCVAKSGRVPVKIR